MSFVLAILFSGLVTGSLARLAIPGPDPMPIWTDLRRHSQACDGRAQDAMVYQP